MLLEVLVDSKFYSKNRYFTEMNDNFFMYMQRHIIASGQENPFFVNFHGTYGPLYKRKLPFISFL